ncbi:MAG: prolyl oligopeptidase family serine peptidase [Chloroflexi bacterium]|nr:prolyl oligopeptidase family serine peptidase [Chloroflexota bacterium]
MSELRRRLADLLGLRGEPPDISTKVLEVSEQGDHTRYRVQYAGVENDQIPAFLLRPPGAGPFPAVAVHHQHNGERHLGKSEVCGLAGDPLQAFGPALVARGLVVLAPDSMCFEDRRSNRQGIEPDPDPEGDWLQHFNQLAYRLVRGETLIAKVLEDSAAAISVLAGLDFVDPRRIGMLGHSYGGNTTLFHAAVDERISFACASGAAASYRAKMDAGTGIEFAEVIPGITKLMDVGELVGLIAPRPLLLVSANGDKYSQDADVIAATAMREYEAAGAVGMLQHSRYDGGHELTPERFGRIVDWLCDRAETAAGTRG